MAGNRLTISGTSGDAPVLLPTAGSALTKYPAILQHASLFYMMMLRSVWRCMGGLLGVVHMMHQSVSYIQPHIIWWARDYGLVWWRAGLTCAEIQPCLAGCPGSGPPGSSLPRSGASQAFLAHTWGGLLAHTGWPQACRTTLSL